MQTPDIEVPGWLTDASKENLIVTSRQLAEYHFLEPMKAGDRVTLRSARNPKSGVVLAVHDRFAWVDVGYGSPWTCSVDSLERQP